MTDPSREERINEAIAAWLRAAEAGEEPDREEWLARHADLAVELRSFLTDHDAVAPVAAPLRAASVLAETVRYFGDYELLEEIGRGGMAVVYRARQVSLNRVVAVKMILATSLASAAEVQRFRQEAEAAANLDHPNIVPVYEVGEHQGQQYFSMKLIAGGSLAEALKHPNFSARLDDWDNTARMMARVARAIHHAHQRGILHRDLKPGNVLLANGGGEPVISDFGLARCIARDSRMTQSGAIVGTPSYMAPEQATGKGDLTTAVDVYGIGATLYEMLTGQPPHRGGTPLDTLRMVLDQAPTAPRTLNPHVDRDLETICLKCLAKEPGRRYPSAEALAEDLERRLRGEPILARPAGRVEKVVKWVRRRPVVAALLALVVLSTAVGLAGILWQYGNALKHLQLAEAEYTRAEQKAEELRDALTKVSVAEGQARDKAEEEKKARIAEETAKKLAQQELDRSAELLLTMQLNRVASMYLHDPIKARELLEDTAHCPLDRRDTAWAFFHRQCRRDSRLLTVSASDGDGGLTLTPDGHVLFTRGRSCQRGDPSFARWESLKTPDEPGTHCHPSPDGVHVVVAGGDRVVLATMPKGDDPTDTVVAELIAGQGVTSVRFSADGKLVALGHSKAQKDGAWVSQVRVWKVADHSELLALQDLPGDLDALAFSSDGTVLALARRLPSTERVDTLVQVWNVAEKKEKFARTLPATRVTGMAFPPHRHQFEVAVATQRQGTPEGEASLRPGAILMLASDRKHPREVVVVQELPDGEPLHHLAWSADGSLLACTLGNRDVRLYDPSGRDALIATFQHLDSDWGIVEDCRFAPDGRSLLVLVLDKHLRIKLWQWDVALRPDGALVHKETRRGSIGQLISFSPDSRTLLVADPGGNEYSGKFVEGDVCLRFDVATRTAVETWKVGKFEWLAVDVDHDTIAVVGSQKDRLRIIDRLRREEREIRCPRPIAGPPVFSPDGTLIAAASSNEGIHVWIPDDGTKKYTLKVSDLSSRLAISPVGFLLASADHELPRGRGIKLWHLPTERARYTFDMRGFVRGMAFSPDGRLLAGSTGFSLRAWDTTTGLERFSHDVTGSPWTLGEIAFSPDGRTLAVARYDNPRRHSDVQLWNVTTWQERAVLPATRDTVSSLTFSADGNWLAAASRSEGASPEVRLWDLRRGPEHLVLNTGTGADDQLAWTYQELLALSRDGRTLATGKRQGEIRLWDVATGRPLRTFRSGRELNGLSFTPDGERLISLGDETGGVWKLTGEGDPLRFEFAGSRILGVSPDGKKLAGKAPFATWALAESESQGLAQPPSGRHRMAFSRDSKLVATLEGDGDVLLRETAGGKIVHRLSIVNPQASSEERVEMLAFSPNGRTLVVGYEEKTQNDGVAHRVRLWDVKTGQERAALHCLAEAKQIAFVDDRTLALLTDRGVRLWDLDEQRERALLPQPDHRFVAMPLGQAGFGPQLVVSADGKVIAAEYRETRLSRGDRHPRHIVHVWKLDALPPLAPLTNALAFSPDGKLVAAGRTDHTIHLYDVSSWRSGEGAKPSRILRGHGQVIRRLLFTADGKHLISATGQGFAPGEVKLWDLTSGTERLDLSGHEDQVSCLALSRDGRLLATGSWDRSVRVWDVVEGARIGKTPTARILRGPTTGLEALTFSSDGKTLIGVTASRDLPVKRWDWDLASGEGKAVWTDAGGYSRCVNLALSPDGNWAAGLWAEAHQFHFVITQTGGGTKWRTDFDLWPKSAAPLESRRQWNLATASFTPDGKHVASGTDAGIVSIWRLELRREEPNLMIPTVERVPRRIQAHDRAVRAISLSPDGKRFVSAGEDGQVKLWDVPK